MLSTCCSNDASWIKAGEGMYFKPVVGSTTLEPQQNPGKQSLLCNWHACMQLATKNLSQRAGGSAGMLWCCSGDSALSHIPDQGQQLRPRQRVT